MSQTPNQGGALPDKTIPTTEQVNEFAADAVAELTALNLTIPTPPPVSVTDALTAALTGAGVSQVAVDEVLPVLLGHFRARLDTGYGYLVGLDPDNPDDTLLVQAYNGLTPTDSYSRIAMLAPWALTTSLP